MFYGFYKSFIDVYFMEFVVKTFYSEIYCILIHRCYTHFGLPCHFFPVFCHWLLYCDMFASEKDLELSTDENGGFLEISQQTV